MAKVELGSVPAPRVLVAEAEAAAAMQLEAILVQCGCEVAGPLAEVGKAIERAEAGDIDIAIVDYAFNGGAVAGLTDRMDAQRIPYAICTRTNWTEIALSYPSTPILVKPYRFDDVALVVDSLIAARLAGPAV